MESRTEADIEMLRSIFRRSNVSMGSENKALNNIIRKVKAMKQNGREKLLVITDFDYTLSRYHVNGCHGSTSFGVIEKSSLMSEQYRKDVDILRSKYAPMEVDPTLSDEERDKAMQSWYANAHLLITQSGLKKGNLEEIVANGNMKLRDGCDLLFDILDTHAVPFVILSAGIVDTLSIAMAMQASIKKNMIFISNNLVFDDNEEVIGFSTPLITSANKGSLHDKFATVSTELEGRTNVILIGDSLDDPKMANSLGGTLDVIIKIGFLNHHMEQLLTAYHDRYDVVITGDGDFSFINQLLQYILTNTC